MLRLLGGLLLFAACVIAFLWFYWLAPFRHVASPAWWSNYSTKRYWIEVQKQLHRTGLDHDSSITLGYWGDKEWFEWLMTKIKPGQDLTEDFDTHLDSALVDMTNQRLGKESNTWLAWWTTNRNRTQLEWIRDGFAQEGIQLQQPLATNNIVTLLKLIAPSPKSTNTNVVVRSRHGFRYNAQRWLRDAGFRPQEFDLASGSPEEKDQVARGLVSYAYWLGQRWDDPGKLPIRGERSDDTWAGMPEPAIAGPKIKWTMYLVMISLAACGVFLMRRKTAP